MFRPESGLSSNPGGSVNVSKSDQVGIEQAIVAKQSRRCQQEQVRVFQAYGLVL